MRDKSVSVRGALIRDMIQDVKMYFDIPCSSF